MRIVVQFSIASFGGANATYWDPQERAPGGAWVNLPKNTTGSQAFSGKGGGTWQYRVQACNDREACDLVSSILSVGVTPEKPALTVPATTQNGGYTVSWNAPASATYYDLQEYANGTWSTIADNTTAISKARPHSGGSYQYRVRAYNSYGTRDYTATSALVKVLPPVPASISTNDATATDSVFTLSWGASAGASNYTLQKRKQNSDGSWGAWSTHATVAATSRAFTYRELADGNWQFQVRANVTNVGSSGWRGTAAVTVEHTPPTPTLTAPSTVMTNSFTVSWTTSSGVINHQLDKSDLVGSSWSAWLTYNVAGTSKQFLESDGNYRFRVRACKTFACSAYSNIDMTEVGTGGGTCSLGADGTTAPSGDSLSGDDGGGGGTPSTDAAGGTAPAGSTESTLTEGDAGAQALPPPGC